MLVNNRILKILVNPIPAIVKRLALKPCSAWWNHGNIRIHCLYCLVKCPEISFIYLAPVFIAKTDIFKIKRLFAAISGTKRTPVSGSSITVGIFNQVKNILHICIPFSSTGTKCNCIKVFFKIVTGINIQSVYIIGKFLSFVSLLFRVKISVLRQVAFPLSICHWQLFKSKNIVVIGCSRLTGQTYIEYRQRLCIQIVAKLKIFVVTHCHCVDIISSDIITP